MRALKELLDVVVDEVTFDLGRTVSESGPVLATYALRPGEVITAEEFRSLVAQPTAPQVGEPVSAISAHVVIPDDLLNELISGVRMELHDYIDPEADRIGHAFPTRRESSTRNTLSGVGTKIFEGVSSVEIFARALARGATLLGTQKVTELLSEWTQGKAISYCTRSILNTDRFLTDPVSSVDGVRIESLPLSTDQLPSDLPKAGGRLPSDYLGRLLLTIDHSAAPALFRPTDEHSVDASPSAGVPGVDPRLICLALSIESDAHTDVAFSWNDYSDLNVFQLARRESTWSTGRSHFGPSRLGDTLSTDFATDVTTLSVTDGAALQIDGTAFQAALTTLADADSATRVAAARWLRTKDTGAGLTDRFIDLRIALESLYLKDYGDDKYRGEMRFRLALYGGWHLGADLPDRKSTRKTLARAYDAASRIVHSGRIDFNPENQELLADAQALCRRGILKILADGQPDWDSLIFGGPEGGNEGQAE